MLILLVTGGLASQLHKYAFAYEWKNETKQDVLLDISDYAEGYFRPYVLDYLSIPTIDKVNNDNIKKHCITIQNGIELGKLLIENKSKKSYYLNLENGDFNNFFEEHPQFWINYSMGFLNELNLLKKSSFLEIFKDEINNVKTSVAIHVRRGDFISLGWNDNTIDFYKAAIAYFKRIDINARFYFFSNDIEWVKKQFGAKKNFSFLENIKGYSGDIEEFFAMSLCKYRILTNFSGYGSFANMLSFRRDVNSYAILNASLKNIDNGVDEISKKIIRENNEKQIEVTEKKCILDKYGNILYLEESEIQELLKNYRTEESIDEEKKSETIKNKIFECSIEADVEEVEQYFDKLALNGYFLQDHDKKKVLISRINIYLAQNQFILAEECLENTRITLDKSISETMWSKIYGVNKIVKSLDVVIISSEKYSEWKIRDIQLFAVILSRLGYNVSYIFSNKLIVKKNKKYSKSHIIDFEYGKDIDGKIYEINCSKVKEKQINDIISYLSENAKNNLLIINDSYTILNRKKNNNECIVTLNRSRHINLSPKFISLESFKVIVKGFFYYCSGKINNKSTDFYIKEKCNTPQNNIFKNKNKVIFWKKNTKRNSYNYSNNKLESALKIMEVEKKEWIELHEIIAKLIGNKK